MKGGSNCQSKRTTVMTSDRSDSRRKGKTGVKGFEVKYVFDSEGDTHHINQSKCKSESIHSEACSFNQAQASDSYQTEDFRLHHARPPKSQQEVE